MQKVAIIGAGAGGSKILNIINSMVKIEWISDLNDSAPGILSAKSMGIPVIKDFRQPVSDKNLDLVIECTGNLKVLELLEKSRHDSLSVISSKGALLMVCLVEKVNEALEKQALAAKAQEIQQVKLESILNELRITGNDVRERSDTIFNEVEQVSGISMELSSEMKGINNRLDQVKNSISSIATATEEMTSSALEISGNTQSVSGLTERAVTNADKAIKWVSDLEIAVKGIDRITELIIDLSEQTKLLALNASIQAARAGDAGKGFSVVAGEVKDLARQTQTASEKIREEIETMKSSTVGTTSEILNISKVVQEIHDSILSVASAIEEQSNTTREVSENIQYGASQVEEISGNIHKINSSASHVSESMRTIDGQMKKLIERTDSFKKIKI